MTIFEPLLSPSFLFLACLAAIVLVVLGEMFREAPRNDARPPRAREVVIGAAAGSGLLLLAAHLVEADSGWGIVAVLAGLTILLVTLYGALWRLAERFVTLGLPLIVIFGVGVGYFNNAQELERGRQDVARRAQEAAKAEEREFVEKIRQARSSWMPGAGVQEFRVSDAVVGWLTVAPKLELDTEYEATLGDGAKRQIPIRIVMLNNSYEDARLPRTPNGSTWRVEVRNSADEAVGLWSVDVGLGDAVLGPAERREFQIPWDGRTAQGALVDPGSYTVSLRPDVQGAAASVRSTIDIVDAGPIRTAQQSDMERQIQSHNETMRMLGDNIRAGQALDSAISTMQMLRR
jgi:hypothetical protein